MSNTYYLDIKLYLHLIVWNWSQIRIYLPALGERMNIYDLLLGRILVNIIEQASVCMLSYFRVMRWSISTNCPSSQ